MLALFGAGTTGRVIARTHKEQIACFVDSNPSKWGQVMEGFEVLSPEIALDRFPGATWIASVMRPERKEILAAIEAMGVKTEPLWEYVPKRHTLPPRGVWPMLVELAGDNETVEELRDQLQFRRTPNYANQRPASDINEIYWPEFICKRDDEHFVDCGAADGDTVREFKKHWEKWQFISAIEPDRENFIKLQESENGQVGYTGDYAAVSDFDGEMSFTPTGDYSAHLGGTGAKVTVVKLDTLFSQLEVAPTFIKMDIEGSEPEALWGARRILKEHKPVLAICAYHEAEHLWELPLLIHALQPEYKLFFRRYAEGTFELVWYALPPERVQ